MKGKAKSVAPFSGKISEERFVYDKRLREEASKRIDVLGKVKELFLIPELDLMTTPQVASYYGVTCVSVNRYIKEYADEFTEDGARMLRYMDIVKMLGDSVTSCEPGKGTVKFVLKDGREFIYPSRGAFVFPRRAVLRLGMVLRTSDIAKEVRTQLLNTFENTDQESHTADIDTEDALLGNLLKAFKENAPHQMLAAAQEVYQFQRRHITDLEEKIQQVSEDNKLLAGQILAWERPSKINKAVRIIAGRGQTKTGFVWKAFYDELLYKHHIGLSMRGEKPYTQHIREEEWPLVQQTLAALCEAHGVSPSYVFKRAKLIEA